MKKNMVILLIIITVVLTGCSSLGVETTEATEVALPASQATTEKGPSTSARIPGGSNQDGIDTSDIEEQFVDIKYGNQSDSQYLNIYIPNDGVAPYPVIVAIHGGAFKMGSATGGDLEAMLEGVNRGYAVVTVNYRLSSEAIFPAAVNDCKAAVRFIKANAATYNLNPDRIAVWGDSAGGNLAMMVGVTSSVEVLNDDNVENATFESNVQAVVNWFGPIDFLKMDDQFVQLGIQPVFGATTSELSPESQYIGQLISLDPELTRKSNPETYVSQMTSDTSPYFMIQHGTVDGNVPYLQSVNLSKKLTEQMGSEYVSLVLLEGAGHGTKEFLTDENLSSVFEFLDEILK